MRTEYPFYPIQLRPRIDFGLQGGQALVLGVDTVPTRPSAAPASRATAAPRARGSRSMPGRCPCSRYGPGPRASARRRPVCPDASDRLGGRRHHRGRPPAVVNGAGRGTFPTSAQGSRQQQRQRRITWTLPPLYVPFPGVESSQSAMLGQRWWWGIAAGSVEDGGGGGVLPGAARCLGWREATVDWVLSAVSFS